MEANFAEKDGDTRQHYNNVRLPIAVPVTDRVQEKQSSMQKKKAYQFSFRKLGGNGVIRLSDFSDKVILIVNVASHCNATTKEYIELNRLAQQYPELVIIGCPCNQFGHQENLNGEEILTSLKYIRPGNNFTPNFELTEKIEVNGAKAHPLYNHLRLSLPFPSDRTLIDDMAKPGGFYTHPMRIVWMPISRTDVSWNFEKVCFQ
uniref:Glutathione peroxidase n=1 Tax=Albugo laibachii Nc14 TaxID=890382 RepID=F0W825_9STRA|nr:glutathione peroxidase 2 putative [Albugo laibachii Nc14]|eukprot:CCA17278.1 glutathione peroxidase 2 putative [Albugo laibachii Nc14]